MRSKYIILTALSFLFFCSCSPEQATPDDERSDLNGVMQVEITENEGAGSDKIKSIRFIVFTNLASIPKAEINRLYSENDFTAEQIPEEEKAASKIKIIMEVSRRRVSPNKKLVVAVVNEPLSMTEVLNAITTPEQLEKLKLPMSDFVADDHLSLKADTPTPMTGAVWTDRVYSTVEEAVANGIKLEVLRAVARVDVYLAKEKDVDVQITAGSAITLSNTYTESYFVRHEDGNNHLGNIQTVNSNNFTDKSWTWTEGQKEIPDPETDPRSVCVCSFYTPERYCISDNDKLKLNVSIVTQEGAVRSGIFTLDKAKDANQDEQTINLIRRNNIYKITATVGAEVITAEIQDWEDRGISVEL